MYRGDIRLGDTIDLKFTTRRFTTGVPFVLAGSPAISAYVGNGTTEITAGITLSVDFDGVVGLNNVRVVASGGNGFASATNVDLVITAGTVDGVSVVGEVIGSFSIECRSALMPTTAATTLDVTAGGNAGIDWGNVANPTTALNLSATNIDVDQIVASVSGAVGSVTGAVGSVTGAVGSVTGNVGGNVVGSVASVTGNVGGNVVGSVGSVVGAVGSVTGAVGSVTGNVGGNVVGSVGSVVGAVGSVTGAVGSVTGNVGGNVVGTVASVVGNVGGNVTGSVGSLAAQAKADVNAEVVDVLSVDTFAQPGQATPAATTTLQLMLGYIYKAFRNKATQTASTYSLFNDDAATVDQKAAVSDDGTTFTKGEIATGP